MEQVCGHIESVTGKVALEQRLQKVRIAGNNVRRTISGRENCSSARFRLEPASAIQ